MGRKSKQKQTAHKVTGYYDLALALSRSSNGQVVVSVDPRFRQATIDFYPDEISPSLPNAPAAGSPFTHTPFRGKSDTIEHLEYEPLNLDDHQARKPWVQAIFDFHNDLAAQIQAEHKAPRRLGKNSKPGSGLRLGEVMPFLTQLISAELVGWEQATRSWRTDIWTSQISRSVLTKLDRASYSELYHQGSAVNSCLTQKTGLWYRQLCEDVRILSRLCRDYSHVSESCPNIHPNFNLTLKRLEEELRRVNDRVRDQASISERRGSQYDSIYHETCLLHAEQLMQRKANFEHIEDRWSEPGFQDALKSYLENHANGTSGICVEAFLLEDEARHLAVLPILLKHNLRSRDLPAKTSKSSKKQTSGRQRATSSAGGARPYVFGGSSNERILRLSGDPDLDVDNVEESEGKFRIVKSRQWSILPARRRRALDRHSHRARTKREGRTIEEWRTHFSRADSEHARSAASAALTHRGEAPIHDQPEEAPAPVFPWRLPLGSSISIPLAHLEDAQRRDECDRPPLESVHAIPCGPERLQRASFDMRQCRRIPLYELLSVGDRQSLVSKDYVWRVAGSRAVTNEGLSSRLTRVGISAEAADALGQYPCQEGLDCLRVPNREGGFEMIERAYRLPDHLGWLHNPSDDDAVTFAMAKLDLEELALMLESETGCGETRRTILTMSSTQTSIPRSVGAKRKMPRRC